MAKKNTPQRATKPPPVCKAILLCDKVTEDPKTEKKTIHGVFSWFFVPAFPVSIPPVEIFLKLVDMIGECTVSAEIHDLQDGSVVARTPYGTVYGTHGERTEGETALCVSGVVLRHPGTYDIVVFADDTEIDRLKFHVKLRGDRAHGSKRKDET